MTATRRGRLLAGGALVGLTWAAGLRGWMADFAGAESAFTPLTFVLVLLPGVAVGMLFGLAEARRRVGHAPSRWLVLAPVLFLAALADPVIFFQFIQSGVGGGSLALVSFGLAGGWALSGRGRRWTRVLAGVFAGAGVLLCYATGSSADPDDPVHSTWGGLYLASFTAVLCVACVLPLRTLDGRPARPWAYPVVGGLCGLAWSCALRALMSQVAGGESTFSWAGTFGWILLPGVAIGALLGWAEHLRRVGGHPGRWRLAFAPLLFVAVLLPGLLDPATLFEGGFGGGAVALPAFFLVGGLALSGRGPWWLRAGWGLVVLSTIPVWALTAAAVGGPGLALTSVRGLWLALAYWGLIGTACVASAIPYWRSEPAAPDDHMLAGPGVLNGSGRVAQAADSSGQVSPGPTGSPNNNDNL